jgi:hypothetical protein
MSSSFAHVLFLRPWKKYYPRDFPGFPLDFEPKENDQPLGQMVGPDKGEWCGPSEHHLPLPSYCPGGNSDPPRGRALAQTGPKTNLAYIALLTLLCLPITKQDSLP